jgi:hypothetical protein
LAEVEKEINNGYKAVLGYETERHEGKVFFTKVGAARGALESASPEFEKVLRAKPRVKKPRRNLAEDV